MKQLINQQYCQWLFTFVWLILGLEYLDSPSIVLACVMIVFFIRIVSLKSSTVFWTVLLSLILVSHFQTKQNHLSELQKLPFNTESEQDYLLQVLPTDVRLGDDYLSGKARLWSTDQEIEAVDVQMTYWFEETDDLAGEFLSLQNKTTIWRVTGNLSLPEGARNFGVFDYQEYLLTQGVAWSLTISDIDTIEVSTSKEFSVGQANLRARLTQPLRQYQDMTWVGLHNKLLFNINSKAFQEYRPDLLSMGVIHYFAISGFHLNYIRRLLSYLLLRTGVVVEIAALILFGLLVFYAWLIQWPAGVIRSLGTFYGRRLCRLFDWPFSSLDQLALVGIIMLLIDPMLFQSAAFRLSFLMSGVIQFYQANSRYQTHEFQYSTELTFVCLSFSWPLIIAMNAEWNGFQFIVVIAFGLVFDRLIMPAMCLSTLALYSLASWPNFEELLRKLSCSFDWLWQSAAPTGWLTKTRVITGIPDASQIFLLMVGAAVWLYFLKESRIRAYSVLGIGYICVLGVWPYARLESSLVVLDVGQGDALLYRPALTQEAWLIDTGGRLDFSNGEVFIDEASADRDLLPALKALGVRRLTGVVITHPDADHMGNLLGLSQTLKIDYVIISPYTLESSLWQKVSMLLPERVQVSVMEPGQAVQVARSNISIITLEKGATYFHEQASNDSSLVVVFKLGEATFVNLGDLSTAGEQRLIKEYPSLQADIIKIGHHGSDTSSSNVLLRQFDAQLALISAGVNNRYGHPHKEVIDRLTAFNLPVLATNKVGAIRLSYHPWWGYRIETALEPP